MPLHRRPRVRSAVVVLVIVYVALGLAWSIVDATMTAGWRGLVATVTLGLLAASCCLLATDFRTATGARVTTAGDPARLAPEARLAVVRTAQEALTNVRKHAHGADVTRALRCGDQWCELDVRDTGGASGDLGDAGGGYGLIGMRERAELLGGSLDARVDGTGFRVLLRVPA